MSEESFKSFRIDLPLLLRIAAGIVFFVVFAFAMFLI